MSEINYTASSDCRTDPVHHFPAAVQIELRGELTQVEALVSMLRQQTQVLEELSEHQDSRTREIRWCLTVKVLST